MIYVDFKAAYHKVDRKILFYKLRKLNVLNEKLLTFLKWIWNSLIVQISPTEQAKEIQLGLPQGSAISPALFNIYIQDLRDRVNSI